MKIKYLIDTLLSTNIKALDFVERYGGMVSTIHTKQDDFEANGKGTIKRYPVACDVNDVDCNNLSIYQDLVPNDTKTSVVYWEELSPMTNVGETATKSFYQKRFRGTARLIVWANLAKLGSSSCNGDLMAMQLELERVISRKGQIQSGLYANSFIKIQPVKDVQQDINTVFGKYDYPKERNYYLYPFGYFAIDVEFQLDYCIAAGAVVPVNPSIDCYNNDGLTDCEKILALLTPELTRTCVQPTIDYSVQENLDALSPTQVTDLRTAFCPTMPSTCEEKLAFIAPVRDTCFIPSLNFATGFDDDFNALDGTQISDLSTRICGAAPAQMYKMSFDGVNEYVITPSSTSLDFSNTDAFSAGVWVQSTNYAATQTLFSRRVLATTRGYIFFFLGGNLHLYLATSVSNYIYLRTSGVTFTNNVEYFVGFTKSTSSSVSGIKLFVNNAQVSTFTILDNLTGTMASSEPLLIGADAISGWYQNGDLSLIRIWGVERTPAEMSIEYNGGTPLNIPAFPSSQRFGWKGGQSAYFGTQWVFPEETGFMDNPLPYSINMEFADRQLR